MKNLKEKLGELGWLVDYCNLSENVLRRLEKWEKEKLYDFEKREEGCAGEDVEVLKEVIKRMVREEIQAEDFFLSILGVKPSHVYFVCIMKILIEKDVSLAREVLGARTELYQEQLEGECFTSIYVDTGRMSGLAVIDSRGNTILLGGGTKVNLETQREIVLGFRSAVENLILRTKVHDLEPVVRFYEALKKNKLPAFEIRRRVLREFGVDIEEFKNHLRAIKLNLYLERSRVFPSFELNADVLSEMSRLLGHLLGG